MKKMIGYGISSFLLALVVLSPRLSESETVDRVVAVVNDDPITLFELDKAMAENIDKIKEVASQMGKEKKFKNYRSMALEALIDDKLLDQELKKRKLSVTPEDLEKAISNVLERNKLTRDQLMKELKSKGTSWAQYESQVSDQIKKIKFMGQVISPRVKVTDADLDEFFAEHPDKFSGYQSVEMAQVIIPLNPDADDASLAAAQKLAEDVARQARRGEKFEDLGKKYSVNAQTAVAQTYPVNQLAPQIAELLSELKPGEISAPVRSNMGLHVLKLFQRSTLAGEEYKAIREQIREKVFEMKMAEELDDYLDDLKGNSFIDIKIPQEGDAKLDKSS